MSTLTDKKCVPCEGSVPALTGESLKNLFGQLKGGWKIVEDHPLYAQGLRPHRK